MLGKVVWGGQLCVARIRNGYPWSGRVVNEGKRSAEAKAGVTVIATEYRGEGERSSSEAHPNSKVNGKMCLLPSEVEVGYVEEDF